MTAYTSSQAGNWNDSATWGGGGTPGDGDTASVGHAVAVTANATVGTSPDNTTTFVIDVNTGGVLTINDGVTLRVKGNIDLDGDTGGVLTTTLQINGSGTIIFDGSAVSSSRDYRLNATYRNAVDMAGTDADNRATIESDESGGEWWFDFAASPALSSVDFAHFKRCSDSSNLFGHTTNYLFEADQTVSITNTVFESCGEFRMLATYDSNSITIEDCEWIDSQGTYSLNLQHGASVTEHITTVNRCVFDYEVILLRSDWMRFTNCYIGGQLVNDSNSAGWDSGSGTNVLVRRTGDQPTWRGTMNDAYFFNDYLDDQNEPSINLTATASDNELIGNIQDWADTSPRQPDGLFITTNASGNKYTVKENFFLPDSAGTASGAWLNMYYSTAGTVDVEHNTVVVNGDGQTGTYIGEFSGGAAGQLTSFKSNLFWTPTGDVNGGGHKIQRHTSSTTQDIADATDCDYNWGWNLAAGSEGDGYDCENTSTAMFSSGTPDSNGGSGDPQFVDSTRNLVRFDIDYLGNSAATAWADATAYSVGDEVSASDAGYFGGDTINWRCITAHTSNDGDSTDGKPGDVSGFRTNWEPMSLYRLREDPTRIADLMTWVKAGFAVQNASLNNAGHDSVTIGAGEYQASGNSRYYHHQQAAAI